MNEAASALIVEVPISAHSILLDHGTYCVFVTAVTAGVPDRLLPALRVSTAPGSSSVAISALPGDGWLRLVGDAVLIRVASQQTRVLLTSYDEARVAGAKPPQIQVQRLDVGGAPSVVNGQDIAPIETSSSSDFIAHIRRLGDVAGTFGQWLGTVGDDTWIEGVELRPIVSIAAEDLEYQVVLGRGWLSPWVQAGEFCGSRGMGLPVLGFRARLVGAAANNWRLSYAGRCVDGRELSEAENGMPCEAEGLVPLAAININLQRLRPPPASPPVRKRQAKAPAKPVVTKPGAAKTTKRAAKLSPPTETSRAKRKI